VTALQSRCIGGNGNVGFLPRRTYERLVELVREAGGKPFVTDTNTLYTGMRRDAVSNLSAAAMNGFSFLTLGAPLLVADGLRGRDFREVLLEGPLVDRAKIASGILDADTLIVLSHVKCHMLFGFGGALKNLGMGCATPAGKQILHSTCFRELIRNSAAGRILRTVLSGTLHNLGRSTRPFWRNTCQVTRLQ